MEVSFEKARAFGLLYFCRKNDILLLLRTNVC